jgi:hypothetical protein
MGIISTVAGTGIAAYSGDGGPPTAAALSRPWGLVIDKKGSLIIADWYNNRVRKLVNTVGIHEIENEVFVSVSPNPSSGNFTIRSAEKVTELKIMNMLGQIIYSSEINDTVTDMNIQSPGTYILYATTKKGVIRNKIVVTE